LAKATSRRVTHMIALLCGAIGLISIFFIKDPDMLLISMIGVGIAWASILAMPYAMLSSILPADKMGYFMGVFNFFIVIPQIIAAGLLGYILKTFLNNESINAMFIGGGSFVIAAILCLFVQDNDKG